MARWRVVWGMAVGVRVASAQSAPTLAAPATGPDPVSRATALAVGGDTAAALALLDSAVRTGVRNGPAWHLIGRLRWEQSRAARRPGYMADQKALRRLQGADTALRLATQFAPDSARYWLDLARFNLQSGLSTMRFAAQGQVAQAVTAAEASGNAAALARARDEQGLFAWRRYEAVANRALTTDNQRLQLGSVTNWRRNQARDVLRSLSARIEPPTGDSDYRDALGHFMAALEADPTNARVGRHVYMALAEKRQWRRLDSLASTRAARYPFDADARLARGLALHRLDRAAEATAAFDSALALLDDAPRARLTRLTRILRPRGDGATSSISRDGANDSASYSALPEGQRRGLEAMYWNLNDPLTLTPAHEYRVEFLARVTFADFRWTDEDQGVQGADSDRGDIHVRYGPPELEMTLAGGTWRDGGVTLVWGYPDGLTFFFDLVPGFATARLALNDRDYVEQVRSAVPVTWRNVPGTAFIDTIPVRLARFRAGGDSTDLVVAAALPLGPLLEGKSPGEVPIEIDFRLFDQFVRVQGVEATQRRVATNGPRAPDGTRVEDTQWIRRLGPGIHVLRVEALEADSRRGARAALRLDPATTAGFGMSDLLIGRRGSSVAPAGAPGSWRDVPMTPVAGGWPRTSPLGLLWEVYEPTSRKGEARFGVAITVEPVTRGGLGGAAVRLFDGLGRAVGRGQGSRDRFTIAFERTVPAAARVVDALSLDLGEVPPGPYRLTVTVTDQATQRQVARTVPIRLF